MPEGHSPACSIVMASCCQAPFWVLEDNLPFLELYVREMWAHWVGSEANAMMKQMEKMTSEKG